MRRGRASWAIFNAFVALLVVRTSAGCILASLPFYFSSFTALAGGCQYRKHAWYLETQRLGTNHRSSHTFCHTAHGSFTNARSTNLSRQESLPPLRCYQLIRGDAPMPAFSVCFYISFAVMSPCLQGSIICDDPHVQGLLGQRIEWAGVSGASYSFLKDVDAGLDVHVRVTVPLEEEFADRQLITGVSVLSQGHSLVIQVKDPSHTATAGCANGVSPCLADGGLQVVVDGTERPHLLFPSRELYIPGDILLSASNLPVECLQFGGDKKWAHMYEEMLQDQRPLLTEDFEGWVLECKDMAAHDWCTKYVAEKGLSHVQSSHAVFKIDTPDVTLRLNIGINAQSQGELTCDGRVLPELELWQWTSVCKGCTARTISPEFWARPPTQL